MKAASVPENMTQQLHNSQVSCGFGVRHRLDQTVFQEMCLQEMYSVATLNAGALHIYLAKLLQLKNCFIKGHTW